ncbi:MAG: hypothetical protein WAO28_02140 [Candidatus Microsaccharimonas sp.]
MKLTKMNITLGLVMSLLLSFAFVPQLFAVDDESTTPSTPTKKTTETRSTERESKIEERRDVAREKLDAKKKSICESREGSVNRAITNVFDRSQNHYDRITKVYDLTVAFYDEKNLTISNYDELVANVVTTKAVAETALTELKNTPKLSCDSDGPKADIQAFRNKRLDKVEAFGAYRDAVKAFVKAVRAAAVTTETETPATEVTN